MPLFSGGNLDDNFDNNETPDEKQDYRRDLRSKLTAGDQFHLYKPGFIDVGICHGHTFARRLTNRHLHIGSSMHSPVASQLKSFELVCFSGESRIGRIAKRNGLLP